MMDTDVVLVILQKFKVLNCKQAGMMVLANAELEKYIPDNWVLGRKCS